jgi:hypothetical protein
MHTRYRFGAYLMAWAEPPLAGWTIIGTSGGLCVADTRLFGCSAAVRHGLKTVWVTPSQSCKCVPHQYQSAHGRFSAVHRAFLRLAARLLLLLAFPAGRRRLGCVLSQAAAAAWYCARLHPPKGVRTKAQRMRRGPCIYCKMHLRCAATDAACFVHERGSCAAHHASAGDSCFLLPHQHIVNLLQGRLDCPPRLRTLTRQRLCTHTHQAQVATGIA